MNNEFVPFELAVKLKEKGYPQRTFGDTDMQGACYIEDGRFYENGCITEVARAYTAPTISQVLKWLREEKKIHIEIFLYNGKYGYFVNSITQICEDDLFHKCLNEDAVNEEYTTYEQVAIAGIEYVLDNLI